MKSILQIEDAQLILADYNTKIAESIKSGFDDCLGFVTEINKNGKIVEFNKTVLAGMVHTFIKARIKENFSDIENIETKEFNRIFGLHINQIIFIRFKKINNDFSTSNIKTKQTQKFERQNEIDGLPKKSTFLYAGYIPDPTWTSIKNIYIMCKSGGNIIWYKDLTSLVEQTQFDFNNIQYNDIKTPIVTIKELETIKEVNEIITTRVLIKKDKIKTISKEAK